MDYKNLSILFGILILILVLTVISIPFINESLEVQKQTPLSYREIWLGGKGLYPDEGVVSGYVGIINNDTMAGNFILKCHFATPFGIFDQTQSAHLLPKKYTGSTAGADTIACLISTDPNNLKNITIYGINFTYIIIPENKTIKQNETRTVSILDKLLK